MAGKWSASVALGAAVRHLRAAKRLLSDERMERIYCRLDTSRVCRIRDELFELDDIVDEMEMQSSNMDTRFLEEATDGR